MLPFNQGYLLSSFKYKLKPMMPTMRLSTLLLGTLTGGYIYSKQPPKPQIPQTDQIHPPKHKTFKNREQHLQQVTNNPQYDIVIIGGGCNGVGTLLDASTRGFKTLLVDQHDFASGTSSKSTKLIHGGVRYLEQVFEFKWEGFSSRWEKLKLVIEAIKQRSYMMESAAYMTNKIPFVLPCSSLFQTGYYYIGSVLYYLIYWFNCPRARIATSTGNGISFNFPMFMHHTELSQQFPFLSEKYQSGIIYEDGSFNDSRMIISALLTATEGNQISMPGTFKPANALNRTAFKEFMKDQAGKIIGVVVTDLLTQNQLKIKCKYVVNCTGIWSDKIRQLDNPNASKKMCMVAGSHITYHQKISSAKYGLCLASKDGRITLVAPWSHRVIAGTTERTIEEPEQNPVCSTEERMFLNEAMISAMDKLTPSQLYSLELSRWCGVRPLVKNSDAASTKDISRTHVIQHSESGLYSLMGGKWTIYRKMGEDVIDRIVTQENSKLKLNSNSNADSKLDKKYPPSQTKGLPLLGSSPNQKLCKLQLIQKYGAIGCHLYQNYGSNAYQIIKGELTPILGPITQAQIEWICKNELVSDIEDILLRRTRAAFIFEREHLFAAIGPIARIMYQGKDEEWLKSKVEEVAQRIATYEYD